MADPWAVVGETPAAHPGGDQWKVVGETPAAHPQSGFDPMNPDTTGPLFQQVTQGATDFATGLPGLPLDIAAGVGNFMRRNFGDGKDVPLSQTPLKDWGSEGWQKFAQRQGVPEFAPAPTTEPQRLARKAGSFIAGGALFGPAAAIPTVESFAGSEAGRFADKVAPELTHGYGEFAGGLIGPGVRPAVRGTIRGVQSAMSGASPDALAPSNAALKAESAKAFDAIRNSDVIVKPQAVNRLAQSVRDYLANQGYTPKLQTGIGAFLDELDTTIQNGNTTYQGLVNLRRIAQNAGKGNVAGGQGHMAGALVDKIDDFLDDLPNRPHEIVSGSPAEAIATLKQANSAYSRLRKSETLDEAIQRGLDQAGPHVGNVEGMISTQLKGLLRNQKTARQFSSVEREAIRRIVHGDNIQNVLRFVGKFSPENIIPALFEGSEAFGNIFKMGAGSAGATAAGGPLAGVSALGVMASGLLARRVAGMRTNSAINALSEQLRRGDGATSTVGRTAPPPVQEPPASPQGPRTPIIPPSHQLPAPSRVPMSATMYSNPLDPQAIKQLFFKGKPPSAKPPAQGTVAARPAGQTAAEYIRSQKPPEPEALTLGPENEAQVAYHGTPHDFEKFDLKKIGTGEGAQAYGHGLYFAENEKVAQQYRDTLTEDVVHVRGTNGKTRAIAVPADVKNPYRLSPEQVAANEITNAPSLERARESLIEAAKEASSKARWNAERASRATDSIHRSVSREGVTINNKNRAAYERAIKWLDVNKDNIEVKPGQGRVYQVAIKARPEEFLDWDKPLSEQSPDVRKALGVSERDAAKNSQMRGVDLYDRMAGGRLNLHTGKVLAADVSKKLKALGIKGIRYLDGSSRGQGAGSSNYVIFDDKIISVLKKYGIPFTVTAGGAALVAGSNLPPDLKAQIEGNQS